jgi:hypothetical protein
VFVGKLAAVAVGAEIVDLGMVVSLGKGLFVEAGPTQLLSSAKITTKYKSDRVCLSSAMKFFIEVISWNLLEVSIPFLNL